MQTKRGKGEQKRSGNVRKGAPDGAASKGAGPRDVPYEEHQRILHELEVRQIELETQNDELRKVQTELEEARARYCNLYDFAPVAYLTLDERGLILEANLTAARELGAARDRLIGRPFQGWIAAADTGTFHHHIRDVFKSDQRQTCEIRLRREGGAEFYAQLETVAGQDVGGRKVCRTSAIDITEHKRAEEALRESVQNFGALAENAYDGILIATSRGNHLYANKRATEITGYSKDELLQINMRDLAYPDEFPKLAKRLQERLSGEPVLSQYGTLIVKKDGPIVPVEITCAKTVWQWQPADLVIIRDITERRTAEEALRQSEELSRSMIDSSPDCVKLLDIEGNLKFMSVGGQQLMEIQDIKPLLDTPYTDFWKEEDKQSVIEAISKASEGSVGKFQAYCPSQRGTPKWWDVVISPMFGANGEVKKLLSVSRDITDRKRAEEEITSLSRFPGENPYPVLRLTSDGTMLFANEAGRPLLDFWGCRIGQPLPEYWRKLTLDVVGSGLRRLAEVGYGDHILSLTFAPVKDADYVNVYGLDVTERKRAEQSLRESEERFRGLVETMAEGVLLVAPDGRIVHANPAAEGILGLGRSEITGRNYVALEWKILRPDGTPMPPEEIIDLRAMKEKRVVKDEVMGIVRPDGSISWISVSASPLFNGAGEFTGIVGTFADITPLKRAEMALRKAHEELEERVRERTADLAGANDRLRHEMEEHKRAEESLRESEERFRQLAESIDQVFWMATPDHATLIYISPAYEKLWGRTCQSAYQAPASWLEGVHPEDRGRVDFTPPLEEREWEYRVVRPDGSIRWVRARSFPVRDGSGRVYRIAGIAEDITERKRLEQESRYRLQQLVQADKLASLGRLVAGVAHEVNNPNSFIAYNAPILQETWSIFEPILADYAAAHPDWRKGAITFDDLCRDMREIIEAIKTGSDRIKRVVTQLRDFARMDEGREMRPVQINEVVKGTLTIVGAYMRQSASRIEVTLGDNLPEIEGHFHKLEQVMANLLINAAGALLSRDTGRIWIRTRYVERLRAVLIEIEDNGTGMERATLERIFEPFFTTRRDMGGTGLGLSVSYGLIEEHHGRIAVLSRPGLGTRFTVFLPLDRDVKLDLRPLVLCAGCDVRFLNELKVQFLGVRSLFLETADTEETVKYIEEHPEVDVIVSHIAEDDAMGWEVLKRTKARFPLLAVVLCSDSPIEGARRGKPDGVAEPDYLLQKPVDSKKLSEIMRTIGRQIL